MTTPRDRQADDLFLDRCLDEELGGRRPPDLCARVRGADPTAMANAAAAVAAAAVAASQPGSRMRAVLAACLLVGLVAAWALTSGLRATLPEPAKSAQALLDEFHRVMPMEPVALRDPEQRRRLAATALPVLRDIITFLADHPDLSDYTPRAAEFSIYAVVLGDASTQQPLAERARSGDPSAQAQLEAAAIITAIDDAERTAALAALTERLRHPFPTAACVIQCLVTAADLSEREALRLADSAADPEIEQRLRFAAAIAATDPRRLLGKPLDLVGRLANGAEFTTASLRGKVVLVFFWASWCQPCAAALPEVTAAHERYGNQGLAVVSVSCDHDRTALARCLAEHPEMSWPQLFNSSRPGWHELAFWCGVQSIPRLFLIDKQGVLREVNARDDLDALVRRLLAK